MLKNAKIPCGLNVKREVDWIRCDFDHISKSSESSIKTFPLVDTSVFHCCVQAEASGTKEGNFLLPTAMSWWS